MKDLRLVIRVKNNVLVTLREKRNLCQSQMAREIGIHASGYGELENLKIFPLNKKNGKWTKQAIKVSKYFKILPEDLFPKSLLAIKNPVVQVQIDSVCLGYMLESSRQLALAPDGTYEQKERVELALKNLSPKEKDILMRRIVEEETLESIGQDYNVSRDRIRQIEAKALAKTRQNKRSKTIYEVVNKL